MDNLKKLYKSLSQRKRPEDIAEIVLAELAGDLTALETKLLRKASKGSLSNRWLGYTSMLQEFATVVGAQNQVAKAIEIFELKQVGNKNYNDIEDVKEFITNVAPLIHKPVGGNNFVTDRLNKIERKSLGLDISKRNYNKKWRLLKRLENKLIKIAEENKKVEFQKMAKHGIVHRLDFENFQKDRNTACFIAYYNARCNMRSVFTNKSQERSFDEISNMLLERCKKEEDTASKTNWLAIAYIYSSPKVLSHLTDEQKGKLLGTWTNIIGEIANLLGVVWKRSRINRKTMIVKKGNDSTTWNNTAGAWNKARDNWMNLIYALGMDYVLDEICFGKVMRLMAADVAYWHRATGGKLEPNTEVWNKLPLPWEVFKGKANCNKNLVRKYCKQAGINAVDSGWIAPRKPGAIAEFKPTPELVHGVAVSSPFLATVLKRHKYFSGKKLLS